MSFICRCSSDRLPYHFHNRGSHQWSRWVYEPVKYASVLFYFVLLWFCYQLFLDSNDVFIHVLQGSFDRLKPNQGMIIMIIMIVITIMRMIMITMTMTITITITRTITITIIIIEIQWHEGLVIYTLTSIFCKTIRCWHRTRPPSQYKNRLSKVWGSHVKDKTIARPSYL